jgi:hypothetical protein
MSHRNDLMGVIRDLYGVTATHIESVPVKEVSKGAVVWDGIVEIFEIRGDSRTDKVYGWSHDTDDPKEPRRYVTALHIAPVTSPGAAVRAHIHDSRSRQKDTRKHGHRKAPNGEAD